MVASCYEKTYIHTYMPSGEEEKTQEGDDTAGPEERSGTDEEKDTATVDGILNGYS